MSDPESSQTFRSWEDLLAALYSLRRFGIKPGLERMKEALEKEGLNSPSFSVVTVAGTNGKGTVASALAAVLQAQGLKVGLYTSPHLIDVRERFRVDGVPLPEEPVFEVLSHVLGGYGAGFVDEAQGLTFFELTTLAAALLFEKSAVDVAVMEVGLGGRLDAVNALEPQLAVITTIGKDHTEYLGEEIEDIAREKAGIMREGVAVVLGAQEFSEAREALLEAAQKVGALVVEPSRVDEAAPATIRARHVATVLSAAERFLGERFSEEQARVGLSAWRWPGRQDGREVAGSSARVLLDAAHNPAGVEALRSTLKESNRRPSAILWATLKDKDPGASEELFEELGVPVWGCLVDNPRARSAQELAEIVPSHLWQGAGPTEEVLEQALLSGAEELLVFGSVFLIGEVLQALGVEADELRTYEPLGD